jgi:hypothetical protein
LLLPLEGILTAFKREGDILLVVPEPAVSPGGSRLSWIPCLGGRERNLTP